MRVKHANNNGRLRELNPLHSTHSEKFIIHRFNLLPSSLMAADVSRTGTKTKLDKAGSSFSRSFTASKAHKN